MKRTHVCAGALLALCSSFSNVYGDAPHISTVTEKGLNTHIHASEIEQGLEVPEGLEIADHEPSY